MTLYTYVNTILKGPIKQWIHQRHNFVLEEDRDIAHGIADNNNIARIYKQETGLKYYFNASRSPDLAPIENGWQKPKCQVSNPLRHA